GIPTVGAGIQIGEAATGSLSWKLPLVVGGVEFNLDASLLCGYAGGNVTVWDAASGVERIEIPADETLFPKLALSPDGRQVAMTVNPGFSLTSSGAGVVRVWEVATGIEQFKLQGHSASVTDVAFSPMGDRIATSTGASGHTR